MEVIMGSGHEDFVARLSGETLPCHSLGGSARWQRSVAALSSKNRGTLFEDCLKKLRWA
jgi:hypothetical protein